MKDENEDNEVEVVLHPVQVVRFKDEAQDLTKEQKVELTRSEEQAFNDFVSGRLTALPKGHYPAVYHAILQELARLIVYRMADAAELQGEDGETANPSIPPEVQAAASAMGAVAHSAQSLAKLVQQELEHRFAGAPKA